MAQSESVESKNFAKYLDGLVQYNQIVCYTKTAQETFTASWGTKMRNKAEGVKKGIPDYVIITKKTLLFIELKKTKGKRGGMNGSVISDEQIKWIESLNKVGVPAFVAHGADEAVKIVEMHR